MAIYSFRMQVVSRSSGRSSTAGAAYRGRCCIQDERTGERHDYSRAEGLLDHAILTPSRAPDWARDSERLWNEVERVEKRKDAQLYRENILALPHELTFEQNRSMLHGFVQEHYVKRGMVAQVDIHEPDADGDQRNIHAHIMLTTRAVNRNGFAEKKARNWNDKATLQEWREGWANAINAELERHGHKERVDHRTLTEQGVFREATRHLGPAVSAMERRGEQTRAGEHNRRVEIWNRELADMEWQNSVIEAAIEAEKQRLAEKERQRQEGESRQAAFAKAERERAQQAKAEHVSAEAEARRDYFLRKLDLEREFEAEKIREMDALKAKLAATYRRDSVQAELAQAQKDMEGANDWWSRVSGRYAALSERVETLQLNLANIAQREGEQIGALESRHRQERREFYGLPPPEAAMDVRPDFEREVEAERERQQAMQPPSPTLEREREAEPVRVQDDFQQQAQVPPPVEAARHQQPDLSQDRSGGYEMER